MGLIKNILHLHIDPRVWFLPELNLTLGPGNNADHPRVTKKDHKGMKYSEIESCTICKQRQGYIRCLRF